jgi:hypothetical protein
MMLLFLASISIVIIVSLGQHVTHVRTQTRLYETFLENQFKQESAFTRIWGVGTNDGSRTPAPSSQEESQSNTRTGQTLSL